LQRLPRVGVLFPEVAEGFEGNHAHDGMIHRCPYESKYKRRGLWHALALGGQEMADENDLREEDGKPLRSFFGAETPDAVVIRTKEGASTIISHEAIVEKQLALVSLQPGLRVLEIGVGTGYLISGVGVNREEARPGASV